jgi:hypothetical protein
MEVKTGRGTESGKKERKKGGKRLSCTKEGDKKEEMRQLCT